jgi:hypothetical protein
MAEMQRYLAREARQFRLSEQPVGKFDFARVLLAIPAEENPLNAVSKDVRVTVLRKAIRFGPDSLGKRPKLAVLTVDYVNGTSSEAAERFQGKSWSMRLMGWSAMRASTSRKYALGLIPLSLAVPIRL